MALRSSDAIGVRDPRQIAPVLTEVDETRAPAVSKRASARPTAAAKATTTRRRERGSGGENLRQSFEQRISSREAGPSLGAEPTDYVQVSVAGELQRRVELVSFEIGERHPRLAKHQLILGALLWRYVDYRDVEKMRVLAQLVAAFEESELAEAPLTRRLSARVPVSLKRQAKGAALRLRQTNEEASIRLIVSALVNHHVRGAEDDPRAYAALIELVGEFRAALR
jgi:hypothetical protein